jgi:surface antigen
MTEVVSANNNMMKQQQQDEQALQTKLNQNTQAYDKATQLQAQLAVQDAQLKVAQLNYQATIATATDQKDALLAQKAAAQAAATQVQQQVQQGQASQSTSNAGGNTNTGNSYNVAQGGGQAAGPSSPGNPYPWGQCTWGVYEYFGGGIPTYKGNAGDWVYYANSGLAVGTIAVFPSGVDGAGSLGHVGVVTQVNSDGSFVISETNFYANGGGLGIRDSRTISSAAGVSFIRP